jgi:hypothetical protein
MVTVRFSNTGTKNPRQKKFTPLVKTACFNDDWYKNKKIEKTKAAMQSRVLPACFAKGLYSPNRRRSINRDSDSIVAADRSRWQIRPRVTSRIETWNIPSPLTARGGGIVPVSGFHLLDFSPVSCCKSGMPRSCRSAR